MAENERERANGVADAGSRSNEHMAFQVGNIGEYGGQSTEGFECYIERVEQFLEANGLQSNSPRCRAILLSSIGAQTYSTLRNLLAPEKPTDKSFEQIKDILLSHFSPKPLIIAERFKFNNRVQKSDESIVDYIVELKKLAQACAFGDFLDDALRDRLVCGVRSEAVQRRLLTETDLTFKKACEMCVTMATAARDVKQFQPGTQVHRLQPSTPFKTDKRFVANAGARNKTTGSNGCGNGASFSAKKECWRCGGRHDHHVCNYRNVKCHKCDKIGHLQRKCKMYKNAKAHRIGVDDQSGTAESVSDEVFTVFSIGNSSKAVSVTVNVNDKPVIF